MEKRELTTQGETYSYHIIRKDVKTVRLTVDKDMRVLVTAPGYVSEKKIKEFIKGNTAFIEDNLNKRRAAFERHNVSAYKTGEYFLLLGERVDIVSKPHVENRVFLENGVLYILLSDNNTVEERERRFGQFLKKTAKRVFHELLNQYYPMFADRIKEKPHITIRKMKTKWGSANPSRNKITLNTVLVFAPKPLIAYVLVHELCHFYHLDHSKAFYQKLASIMPDYKQKRKQLRETYGFLI